MAVGSVLPRSLWSATARAVLVMAQCDAGGNPVRRHAGERTAGEREVDEIELFENLQGKPGICPRVPGKTNQIVAIAVEDFTHSIFHIPFERFAFSENRTGDRVETEIVETHERTSGEIDTVQYQPPGIFALPLPK